MADTFISISGLALDADGRLVLSDAELQALEASYDGPVIAGGTNPALCSNSGNCSGSTNNSQCTNTGNCDGSRNYKCDNGPRDQQDEVLP